MYPSINDEAAYISHICNGEIKEANQQDCKRIILKNGMVIDPLNKVKDIKDIAIVADEIVLISNRIYPDVGDMVVNCSGLQIWPGLIDMHLHIGDLFEVTTRSAYCAVQDGVTTGLSPGAGNTFMAPALLGAEMDRGMPLNVGVYLGAANVFGTMLEKEELISLFMGKLPLSVANQKMTRNIITNKTAAFTMGIKDHMGHFLLSNNHINKLFDITKEAGLIYMTHTQEAEHAYRLAQQSYGRPFHLAHANAAGCGTHGDAYSSMQEVIDLCKESHITGEFVTTMLRAGMGRREGLQMDRRARELALSALSDEVINILVSDGQNQSTMKGFGDTRDNIPCILELEECGILSLEQAVASMTSNPAKLIAERTNNKEWNERMGHLGEGAYANITIVDPKYKSATYVIVNGKISSFEMRALRSGGRAGYWVSKFGIMKDFGIGEMPMYHVK